MAANIECLDYSRFHQLDVHYIGTAHPDNPYCISSSKDDSSAAMGIEVWSFTYFIPARSLFITGCLKENRPDVVFFKFLPENEALHMGALSLHWHPV